MRASGENSWMYPYFSDLDYYTRTAQHKYTNPWEVLWAIYPLITSLVIPLGDVLLLLVSSLAGPL